MECQKGCQWHFRYACHMATEKDFNAAVAKALEEARNEAGVSYREITRRTGINEGSLSKWLKGGTQMRVKTVYELCAAIGVNPLAVFAAAQEKME